MVTKTSVTEQIIAISRDDYCSSPYLETQCQPNRMKRVHHDKSPNLQSYHKKEHRLGTIRKINDIFLIKFFVDIIYYRISPNESRSTNTDSDTDDQLYCRRKMKVKLNFYTLTTYLLYTAFQNSYYNILM